MTKTLPLFLVTVSFASAGPLGGGIKLGLPLTDTFDIAGSANRFVTAKTKKYIVGPQVELRLPAGLAIEFNALYTRTDFSGVGGIAGSILNSVVDADSWEYPLLLKYTFGGANAGVAAVRPFVDAGASFRRRSDLTSIGRFITGSSGNDDNDLGKGFVIGGGVEIKALFLRISPEVRFTRWGVDSLREGFGGVLRTNRNQGQVLVGISF